MSDSYSQRKWAGEPHSEKKRHPPEEPSKLAPRKKARKEDVINTSLWHLMSSAGGDTWRSWVAKVVCPFTGAAMTRWSREHGADHVVKRLKGIVKKDTRLNIFWVEAQATKKQLTPEFSNYDCLVNWLVFYGIKAGFLKLSSFIRRDKTRVWRLEHK